MLSLLQIAKKVNGKNPPAIIVTYNMDNIEDPWEGKEPQKILHDFQENESVFNSIQKKPFIHLVIKGDSILHKTFNFNDVINLKNFKTAFVNYNQETTLVSASKFDSTTGQALFLPQFKLNQILETFEHQNFFVANVSLCNANQPLEKISFRINTTEISENNIESQWFHAFKNLATKGAIFLISLFAILFGAEKIQVHFLKNQISENSLIEAQIQKLKDIDEEIAKNRQLIYSNTSNIIEFKHPILNHLALSCPKDLQLLKIQINPILNKISPNKEINFERGHIQVWGNTHNLPSLHNWITELNNEDWVKSVKIIEINQNSDRNLLKFHFNITKKNESF